MKTKWIILVLLLVISHSMYGETVRTTAPRPTPTPPPIPTPKPKLGDRPLQELASTCRSPSTQLHSYDFSSSMAYNAYLKMCESLTQQNQNSGATGGGGAAPTTSSANPTGPNIPEQKGAMTSPGTITRMGRVFSNSGTSNSNSSSASPSAQISSLTSRASTASAFRGNLDLENMMNRKNNVRVRRKTNAATINNAVDSKQGTPSPTMLDKTSKPDLELKVSAATQVQCREQFNNDMNNVFSGPGNEHCCRFMWGQIQTAILPDQVLKGKLAAEDEINPMALLSQSTDPSAVQQLRAQTMQKYIFADNVTSVEHDYKLLASLLSYSAKAFGPLKVAEHKDQMLKYWRQNQVNQIHSDIRDEIDKELEMASTYLAQKGSGSGSVTFTPLASDKKQAYNDRMIRLKTMCQGTFANLQSVEAKSETQLQ